MLRCAAAEDLDRVVRDVIENPDITNAEPILRAAHPRAHPRLRTEACLNVADPQGRAPTP
jgi:hypothetical protein